MLLVTKIVCPTDFSDHSFKTISAANEIACHFNAELHILHVVPTIPIYYSTPESSVGVDVQNSQKDIISRARRRMESMVSERVVPGTNVHTVVIQGGMAYWIVKYSEEINADLIVISTRGHMGWKRVVFGSVADKVFKLSRCPVLTLHPG
ncbi:MAG: universal stress protein [Vulcanimicrobiota bacterium]